MVRTNNSKFLNEFLFLYIVCSNLARIPKWMKHGLKLGSNRGSSGRVANGNDAKETIPWQVRFMFSKKATKSCVIFTVKLTVKIL